MIYANTSSLTGLLTTGLNCTEPGAEVNLIGNFVTSIKGLEALPVPVESLRLRLGPTSMMMKTTPLNLRGAENDGHENDGPSKLQGMKLQDMTNISLLWKI